MELQATIYSNRDYLGKLRVVDRGNTLQEFDISAKVDPDTGLSDAPAGVYRLVEIKYLVDELQEVKFLYGETILYFERVGGQGTVRSNCDGKFILALHGGRKDLGNNLLTTDGGVRIGNDDLSDLIRLIGERDVNLTVEEGRIGLLGRFTASKVSANRLPKLRSIHWNRRIREDYSEDDGFPYWLLLYMWMDDSDSGDMDGTDLDDSGDDGVDDYIDDSPIDVGPADVAAPDDYVPAVEQESPAETAQFHFKPAEASWIDPPKDPDPVIADPFAAEVSAAKPESWEPPVTTPEPEPPSYSSSSSYESKYEAPGGTTY
jgi:hypothetical protein